jgi:hypothetical protein
LGQNGVAEPEPYRLAASAPTVMVPHWVDTTVDTKIRHTRMKFRNKKLLLYFAKFHQNFIDE